MQYPTPTGEWRGRGRSRLPVTRPPATPPTPAAVPPDRSAHTATLPPFPATRADR